MNESLFIAQAATVDFPPAHDQETLAFWERFLFQTLPPGYRSYLRPLAEVERTPEAAVSLAGANTCLVGLTAGGECTRKFGIAFQPASGDPELAR